MATVTMIGVLVLALSVLGATAAMELAAVRRRARTTKSAWAQLDAAARSARRQMNRAAGQSWRNIVD